jgi:hypothetical protein
MRMAAEAEPEGHPDGGSERIGSAVAPLIASGLSALR